jgi:methylated-DNA-[protein]-cysteine S-methyltransferase
MTETGSFYSGYLEGCVSVVVEEGTIQQVTFERNLAKNRFSAVPAAEALEKYLQGANVDLSAFPVDLARCTAFEKTTLQCARRIPRGSIATYSQLAAQVGSPRAARSVGNALRRNPVPLFVPCHRVVGASGLGGFAWGLNAKRKLLELEGVHRFRK